MDSAQKQRLLGAAVLIALAIIFVPMFLGNAPPKEASTIQNLDIPPQPERKFETRTLPVDPSVPANPGASASAANPPPVNADKIVTVDTRAPTTFEAPDAAKPHEPSGTTDKPAASVVATSSKPPAAVVAAPVDAKAATATSKPIATPPAPGATPVVPAAAGRFTINLGVYVDQGHADALVARLKKAGFAAYSEATDYQGKSAQRVRVGPFGDRASAEAARLKIKQREPKLPSSVAEGAEAPVAEAPQGTLAPNRAGGWAVQIGAFKAEAEANKLRDRVRGAGIATFVDRTGSGDAQMWRVRAGPYAERSGAEAARATLKAKVQIEGMIVTQP